MATQDWLNYFSLLEKLAESLEELADLQQEKTVCVNKGNLPRLEEIMKKEQTFALSLRGLEQKRLKNLALLDVPAGGIGDLYQSVPKDLKEVGKPAIDNIQRAYGRYNEHAKVSRQTLEAHLGQLEEVTGIIKTGYQKPKETGERSLEKEGLMPKTPVGNVPLNLRRVRDVAEAQHKILHPISQDVLKRVQKEQDDYEQALETEQTASAAVETQPEVVDGNMTSALRQFAQQEERNRTSALQKKSLKENAQNNPQ